MTSARRAAEALSEGVAVAFTIVAASDRGRPLSPRALRAAQRRLRAIVRLVSSFREPLPGLAELVALEEAALTGESARAAVAARAVVRVVAGSSA